tara:strand:+ start:605 stop:823 length:219 start_codon:yes stop_codon:yes gene_type:complete
MSSKTQGIDVEFYRLLTLRSALELEILGMGRRGRSVYSIIKEEFGFKGNKQKVYDQIDELIKKMKEKNHGND